MIYLVDSHCHLASLSLKGKAANNIDEIIERARRCGVSHFLSIACTSKELFKYQDTINQDYAEIQVRLSVNISVQSCLPEVFI